MFVLKGVSPKGVVEEDGDMKYLVATDDASNDLYVMTIPSKNEPRYMTWPRFVRISTAPYYIKERKRIPKTVRLINEIFVKSVDFEHPVGKVVGKRIIIASTGNDTRGPRIFVAVFNT